MRFQTVTRCPARSGIRAIARPIIPKPMTPRFTISLPCLTPFSLASQGSLLSPVIGESRGIRCDVFHVIIGFRIKYAAHASCHKDTAEFLLLRAICKCMYGKVARPPVQYGERERPEHLSIGLLIDAQVAHAPRTVPPNRLCHSLSAAPENFPATASGRPSTISRRRGIRRHG